MIVNWHLDQSRWLLDGEDASGANDLVLKRPEVRTELESAVELLSSVAPVNNRAGMQ